MRVERVRAISNGRRGIYVGTTFDDSASVTGCSAIRNGDHGIDGPEGSEITGNVSNHNHGIGILARDGSVVSGLSPALHYGHISAHEVFHTVAAHEGWTPARITPPHDGRRRGWWGMSESAEAFIDQLKDDAVVDFWQVASRLSRAGFIRPLASRGIVAQVMESAVAYDADTTSGGSGGPVIRLDGSVVAVNTAILPEYGGSNLGVPTSQIHDLTSVR